MYEQTNHGTGEKLRLDEKSGGQIPAERGFGPGLPGSGELLKDVESGGASEGQGQRHGQGPDTSNTSDSAEALLVIWKRFSLIGSGPRGPIPGQE